MKPVAFDYVRPASLRDAVDLLKTSEGSGKPISGGQSLGPMLNLRLARPSLLIDISRLPELRRIEDRGDRIFIGGAITHAEVEDGQVPDVTAGLMQAAAGRIAYRAIRNRGTIGGSLAHCDPAGDWQVILAALEASAVIAADGGERRVAIPDLMLAAFTSVLDDHELVSGVEVPKLSHTARWGHARFSKKVGKSADASAAVVIDWARHIARIVISQSEGGPLSVQTLEQRTLAAERCEFSDVELGEALDAAGAGLHGFELQLQIHNLKSAFAQAFA